MESKDENKSCAKGAKCCHGLWAKFQVNILIEEGGRNFAREPRAS